MIVIVLRGNADTTTDHGEQKMMERVSARDISIVQEETGVMKGTMVRRGQDEEKTKMTATVLIVDIGRDVMMRMKTGIEDVEAVRKMSMTVHGGVETIHRPTQ